MQPVIMLCGVIVNILWCVLACLPKQLPKLQKVLVICAILFVGNKETTNRLHASVSVICLSHAYYSTKSSSKLCIRSDQVYTFELQLKIVFAFKSIVK